MTGCSVFTPAKITLNLLKTSGHYPVTDAGMTIRFDTAQPLFDSLRTMRRITAIETTLALLLAFCLAPFQHVHTGPDGDHAHAGEIHSHFLSPHAAVHPASGVNIDDDDDDHAQARSLDTFTLVLPHALPLCLPSRAPAVVAVPARIVAPIAVVEERAHDPPCLDTSSPRPPPL